MDLILNPTSHTYATSNKHGRIIQDIHMQKLLTLALLLVCSTAFQINPSSPSSTQVAVPPNAEPLLWLIRRSIMKGAPYIGFYVNKTIYAFPNYTIIPGISLSSAQPT